MSSESGFQPGRRRSLAAVAGAVAALALPRIDFAKPAPAKNRYTAKVMDLVERSVIIDMLYAKNLGDSRGITNYTSSGAPGLNGQIAVIQPRTLGVTLSAKF